MTDNKFHRKPGLAKYIPSGAPSLPQTLRRAWECAVSYLDYNCYAYAMNLPDHGSAKPGTLQMTDEEREAAQHISSPEILHMRLLEDGLEHVEKIPACVARGHYIAAFYKPEDPSKWGSFADYHFCRLDCGGDWSHKNGRNVDPEALINTSPVEDALPWGYEFVGFYKVPAAGIVYRQRFAPGCASLDGQALAP